MPSAPPDVRRMVRRKPTAENEGNRARSLLIYAFARLTGRPSRPGQNAAGRGIWQDVRLPRLPVAWALLSVRHAVGGGPFPDPRAHPRMHPEPARHLNFEPHASCRGSGKRDIVRSVSGRCRVTIGPGVSRCGADRWGRISAYRGGGKRIGGGYTMGYGPSVNSGSPGSAWLRRTPGGRPWGSPDRQSCPPNRS